MPATAAASRARSGDRLATARSSAFAARAKAGSRRSLILATPRMPQRTLVALVGMVRSSVVRGPLSVDRKFTLTVQCLRCPGHGQRTTDNGPRTNTMCLLALFFRVVEDA